MVEHALNPIRQSFHEHCAAGMVCVIGTAVTRLCVPCTVRIFTVAMADALGKVPDAEVDPEGTFKYILVRIKVKDGTEYKDIVRGTKSAGQYHNHIFEKVTPPITSLGLECNCLGGGKIEHNSKDKKLRVFGESTGYGKADHSVSVEKLKSVFKDYEITWSDDKE